MLQSGATDPNTRALINALKRASSKNDAKIWRRIAELIARPARKRAEVNVGKIGRHTRDGEVLGSGILPHKVTVAALNASVTARSAIIGSGGSLITINELLNEHPKGTGVTIIT